MEIPNIVQKLDSYFPRRVRSMRQSGQEIVSWEVGDQTITVNETEVNRCARICLKNTNDTVCLYLLYMAGIVFAIRENDTCASPEIRICQK